MSDKSFQVWLVPLALLLLCIFSYGLLIPWLGFYWDDWPFLWISYKFGPAGVKEDLSLDRPFLSWLYVLTTSVLSETPLQWHLLALLTRWLSAVALWWSLRGVWPQRVMEVTGIAFLFAVYPGYVHQPVSFMSQGNVIPLVLFIFSLGAMVWSLRAPRLYWFFVILALLSSALSMMLVEYFIGLELLRPVLLWLVLTERIPGIRQRLRQTLVNWFPYLAVLGIFLIWRLFFFESTRMETDPSRYLTAFKSNLLSELVIRLRFFFTDLIEATVIAWGQTFKFDLFHGRRIIVVTWGLVFLCSLVLSFLLLRKKSKPESNDIPVQWSKYAIMVGIFAMAVGGLPVWFSGRELIFGFLYDRYALPFMLGACIFLVGSIQVLIRTQLQRILVMSVLVGLAAGFHFRNANNFRQDWSLQKSLFWQLSWRVPSFKSGTAVLIDERPLSFPIGYSRFAYDHALTAPLNFIYSPQHSSAKLEYWFFNLSVPQDRDILSMAGDFKGKFRSLSFSGSKSNSLAVWFSPPGCLRVLDPSLDELPQLPALARRSQRYSKVDRIVTTPGIAARPPAEIFGAEPGPCWCYYFQKADLARQMGDWNEVTRMGDEARRQGLKPEDATEWLPFIEGYINVEQYNIAGEIYTLALKQMPAVVQPALQHLCERLEKIETPDLGRKAFISNLKTELAKGLL